VSTASQGKPRYPGAGMHDGRCVVAARGVGVGGTDATISRRILTNSFALAHGRHCTIPAVLCKVTSYRFSCQIPQCGNQPEPGSADDRILIGKDQLGG
jgi:hypothetical protein